MYSKNQTDFPIFIENNKNLDLETNSILRKISNLFLIPVLNNLPKNFKNKIKKTNRAAAEVIDNATNHNALEVLYSRGNTFSSDKILKKIFQHIWFNLDNSRAVRNRLKIVRNELHNYLESIAKSDKEINIISIASGSSRAIIETVNQSRYLDDTKLSITFLDKNPEAIEYSKKLAETINHSNIKLRWINDTVGNYLRSNPEDRYDIVEIVGLLDYFNDDKVVETFKGIHKILQDGGIVITANINFNKEQKFITRVIDWSMIYRKVGSLAKLVNLAGFDYNNIKAFYEPLKVHGIVVAKK